MTVLAAGVSILIVASFVVLGAEDAATSRVTIRRSRATTALAAIGFGAASALGNEWDRLLGAAIGAAMVAAALAIPYVVQGVGSRADRSGSGPERWIGRADVRLGVPFGWTLGWFDVRVAIVGFGLALSAGLLYAIGGRRATVPFVPFLTLGLAAGAGWGVWALLR